MKRTSYYDNAKAILIFLVIVTHVVSLTATYYGYKTYYTRINYLFVLQCFFFISAYFSSKSKKSKKKKILDQIKIYIIWNSLVTIYYAFVLKIISTDIETLFLPRYTYWFLLTLIYYNMMEYIMDKVNWKIMIPLSFIIGILSGFIPYVGLKYSLSRTLVFLPFYTMGYYSKNINISKLRENNMIRMTCILLGIIVLFLVFQKPKYFPLKLLKGGHNYFEISGKISKLCYKRVLIYLYSLAMSAFFLAIIPLKKKWYTKIGKYTLYMYLTQGIILKTMVTKKWLFPNPIGSTIVLIIETIVITYLLARILSRKKSLKNLWKKKEERNIVFKKAVEYD